MSARTIKQLFAALLAASTMCIHAQTTPTSVDYSLCGGAINSGLICVVDVGPTNSLGIYPTMHLYDDLLRNSGGYIEWATMQGPTGRYLGGAVPIVACPENGDPCFNESYPVWTSVCSNGKCAYQVTELTINFEGTYIGGGTYTGSATLYMSYRFQFARGGGGVWQRTVKTGTVTIN